MVSLPENFMKPTTMLYRNLLAMEAEEVARSLPLDGLILMAGCDKTTPALLMGAISVDLPSIVLPAGPMLRGNARGETLGSGRTGGSTGRSCARGRSKRLTGWRWRTASRDRGALHDDGHRQHDDRRRRGDGDGAAGQHLDPGP